MAHGIGWPYAVKDLHFNRLDRVSNRLLGATRANLDCTASTDLEPPWPALVISAGRRTVPIARWIRRQSGGLTRVIQLGRKGGTVARYFDLVVSLAHYHHPPHPQRLTLTLPLHWASAERLAEAATRWSKLLAELPRPRIVLLVGGGSIDYVLDGHTADRMIEEVSAWTEAAHGSLSVVTSRRTGAVATTVLRQATSCKFRLYEWQPSEPDSPYLGYLAGADALVVTSDSESMIAEAAATAKPLYIYPLPQRCQSFKRRCKRRALDRQRSGWPVLHVARWLWSQGLLQAPRDMGEFHAKLYRLAIARPFGVPIDAGPWRPAPDEVDGVLRRIRALL